MGHGYGSQRNAPGKGPERGEVGSVFFDCPDGLAEKSHSHKVRLVGGLCRNFHSGGIVNLQCSFHVSLHAGAMLSTTPDVNKRFFAYAWTSPSAGTIHPFSTGPQMQSGSAPTSSAQGTPFSWASGT